MKISDELKKSESLFRLLAENSKDIIYRMSIPDAIYEYVSPVASEIFGYTEIDSS
jgi:PAS domain-containing protein